MGGKSLDKAIMDVNHGFHQPSQQKTSRTQGQRWGYTGRDTANLDQRKQNRTIELLSYGHILSFKKGKNDPKGDPEITEAAIPTIGLVCKAISSLVS